jgi:hypothetical protein
LVEAALKAILGRLLFLKQKIISAPVEARAKGKKISTKYWSLPSV